MAGGAVQVGEFVLRRVAGIEPVEWRGEVTIHGFTYRLRGRVELRDGRPALTGPAVWAAPADGEGMA